MSDSAIADKKARKDLKAKRDLLFEQYLKNPLDIRRSLEIKIIDDQVAASVDQAERKKKP